MLDPKQTLSVTSHLHLKMFADRTGDAIFQTPRQSFML